MNLYPEQLRRIAAMCDAMDLLDYKSENNGKLIMKSRIPVHDSGAEDEVYGYLVDEDGSGWSFEPVKATE